MAGAKTPSKSASKSKNGNGSYYEQVSVESFYRVLSLGEDCCVDSIGWGDMESRTRSVCLVETDLFHGAAFCSRCIV